MTFLFSSRSLLFFLSIQIFLRLKLYSLRTWVLVIVYRYHEEFSGNAISGSTSINPSSCCLISEKNPASPSNIVSSFSFVLRKNEPY